MESDPSSNNSPPDYSNKDTAQQEKNSSKIIKAAKLPACDYCNYRKIKCDGAHPCFQCRKRNRQCSYERQHMPKDVKTKRRVDNPDHLAQKMDALKIELEEQRNLTEYWKQKFEEVTSGALHQQMMSKKPQFKPETEIFLKQGASSVQSVLSAVSMTIQPFLPGCTWNYSLDHALMLWNRFLEQKPEDFVTSIRPPMADVLAQMADYCALFTIGMYII
jgi:hypothetical protein